MSGIRNSRAKALAVGAMMSCILGAGASAALVPSIATAAVAKHQADDPAGHAKQGLDDPAGHAKQGLDDPAGHAKQGLDDPAGHA